MASFMFDMCDDLILEHIALFLSPISLRQLRHTCRRMHARFDPRTCTRAQFSRECIGKKGIIEAIIARDVHLCAKIHMQYERDARAARYLDDPIVAKHAAIHGARLLVRDERYRCICEWSAQVSNGDYFRRWVAIGCTRAYSRPSLACIGAYRNLIRTFNLAPPEKSRFNKNPDDPFEGHARVFIGAAIRCNNIFLFRRCYKRLGSDTDFSYKDVQYAFQIMDAASAIEVYEASKRACDLCYRRERHRFHYPPLRQTNPVQYLEAVARGSASSRIDVDAKLKFIEGKIEQYSGSAAIFTEPADYCDGIACEHLDDDGYMRRWRYNDEDESRDRICYRAEVWISGLRGAIEGNNEHLADMFAMFATCEGYPPIFARKRLEEAHRSDIYQKLKDAWASRHVKIEFAHGYINGQD